ncbi:MAG: TonB-dependent receptor plug domain-containing protein, partial [Gammaproteobacteria bacterium]|nr:TonB-dependent receptor plug domain-containing protein [Gammaproteobacteria bacterium]
MTLTQTRVGLVAAFVLASSVFPGTANAQEGAVALEEIVVTARRVEERLQDVPLAITAFSAAEIQAAGIENLNDVADLTPGMTFSNLIGEFLPVPVIRSIAPTAVQDRENNAAIFVDGVYVSGREGLNFSQLDLERIEVVKGPQAALYGRNSFSGAVNFVTARPTDEFRGKAELTFGDRGRMVASGAISGPLVEDKLRARVAIILNQWDGSYENQVPDGPDIGGFEYETVQASLYWTPTEQFEAGLSLYVSQDQIDVSALTSVTATCENVSARGVRLANYCGELPSIGKNDLHVLERATGEERDVERAHLTMKLDTALGEISALSGFSNVEQTFLYDGSRG